MHLDRRAADVAEVIAVGEADQLLSTSELAELTGTSTQFWEIARSQGSGPPFVRLSPRRVRYRRSDIVAWLRERTFAATAGYADGWKIRQGRPPKCAAVFRDGAARRGTADK